MKRNGTRRANGGFTLIEVLIAFLLLAVGVLGLAGSQLSSLKYNQTSTFRTQATFLAYNIVDAMRANRSNVASYVGAVKATASPSTIAQTDLTYLRKALDQLPKGDGSIALSGNIVTVTVTWDESKSADVAGMQTFTVKTQL